MMKLTFSGQFEAGFGLVSKTPAQSRGILAHLKQLVRTKFDSAHVINDRCLGRESR